MPVKSTARTARELPVLERSELPARVYFRFQAPERELADLFDPAQQVSRWWNGAADDQRPGVSAFSALDDLYLYLLRREMSSLVTHGLDLILALEGGEELALAHDHDEGEVLLRPARVLGRIEPDKERIAELEEELWAEGFDPDEFFAKYEELDEDR